MVRMDGWRDAVASGWVLVLVLSLNCQLRDVVVGIVTTHLDFLSGSAVGVNFDYSAAQVLPSNQAAAQ